MKPDWKRVEAAATQLAEMIDSVWKVGVLFPGQPSSPEVQAECDVWCYRLTGDPETVRQALVECPVRLRPLILSRFAMAVVAAKTLASQLELSADANEMGTLRALLTDYWRIQVLPNWHCLGEDYFSA